ncbi:MAG: polymer-forming cytoskeletal protein [Flavobacteriales bacterium]|nr:polymer-forming cytoskeletal protein [Flavobacteriales bacterium]
MSESHTPEKLNRIVAGTNIEGEIKTDSNIRIDGAVRGTITAKGRLVVGATGTIDGTVICENADIEGKINGQISVNGLLSLKSTARLECDITTKKLAIEPGAIFTGNCTMGGGVIKEIKNTGVDSSSQPTQARQG